MQSTDRVREGLGAFGADGTFATGVPLDPTRGQSEVTSRSDDLAGSNSRQSNSTAPRRIAQPTSAERQRGGRHRCRPRTPPGGFGCRKCGRWGKHAAAEIAPQIRSFVATLTPTGSPASQYGTRGVVIRWPHEDVPLARDGAGIHTDAGGLRRGLRWNRDDDPPPGCRRARLAALAPTRAVSAVTRPVVRATGD